MGAVWRRAAARLAVAAVVGLLLVSASTGRGSSASADGGAHTTAVTIGQSASSGSEPAGSESDGSAAGAHAGAQAGSGGPAVSDVAATAQPCTSSTLRAQGGREGAGFGTARGEIEVTNIGSAACRLDGYPEVTLLQTDGAPLPVASTQAPGAALHPVTLQPFGGHAQVSVAWINWCGPKPGPLLVSLQLPHSGGAVIGSFDGPPDGAYVPICRSADQRSEIATLVAW